MDPTEQKAKVYLVSRGFRDRDIVYEPNGNIPPDFLIENRIAVEVRLLNKHFITADGKYIPLTTLSNSLCRELENICDALGPPKDERSWYIVPNFQRPSLTPWRKSKRKIISELQSVRATAEQANKVIEVDENLKLELLRAGRRYSTCFVLGGLADQDSGGFVLHDKQKNLEICIEDKAHKVAPYRAKYPEWWLLLIDDLNLGDFDQVTVHHTFDKLIILHRNGQATEIKSKADFKQAISQPLSQGK